MEEPQKKEKRKIYKKLKNKFRLVVMNDDTFEVKFSMLLSALNVFTWGGAGIIVIVIFVSLSIAFTPIRELIPGYADVNTRRIASYAALKADSLHSELEKKDKYIQNIKSIMEGNLPAALDTSVVNKKPEIQGLKNKKSIEDSLLRKKIESEDKYNLLFLESQPDESNLYQTVFFTPLNGLISEPFNIETKHYGVDIIAPNNASIKAALDGTVILATWTSETGHVIQVQHESNLVTLYKHNSVLLKEAGDKVKAGEVIAIIGESGTLTSGPHLHFELWHNGTAVDPQSFIVF